MSRKRKHKTTRKVAHQTVDCPNCDGIGIIQVSEITDFGFEPTRYHKCENCEGTGQITRNINLSKEVRSK